MHLCVFLCVCVRETAKERGKEREKEIMKRMEIEYMYIHKCIYMYRIKYSVTIAHFDLPTLMQ